LPLLARPVKESVTGHNPAPQVETRLSFFKAFPGMSNTPPRSLTARRSGALRGTARVPGDKSISHRALILGAMAVGETRITGLLEAEDVLNTAKAMSALGADLLCDGEGLWRVWGRGVGGFSEPDEALDFGNSGTGSRLVMGAVATTTMTAVFTGDASLRGRPMKRVLEPLRLFGAEFTAREGGLMPVTLKGARQPISIEHEVAVASAQVKSALILAALNAPGRSRIVQRALTRDHTEKMLQAFGAQVTVEELADGGEAVGVTGEVDLKPATVDVPRDPSSAAFPLVAALIVPGSEVTIPGVLLNPRRIGLIATLKEMGADISIVNARESGGEKIGDLVVRASSLKGVDVPADRAPSMIDEYPILAVAAAFAEGRTTMRGLEELRVKESDRLAAIVAGLRTNGVSVEETEDVMIVEGRGSDGVPGGGTVTTHMDHRIAMSFLVMGLAAREAVTVDDILMIATSFPAFEGLMRDLGAEFSAGGIGT
jgi:3-phosphoshikimate 1-carboxyvinyltransferase